jgi:hypothetical protein
MEVVVVRKGAPMAPIDEATLEALTAEVTAEAEAAREAAGATEMKE